MGTLIDSSVLIAAERRQLDLQARLAERSTEDFAISAITASEILAGVHRASQSARRARRQAFVEFLLAQLPVVPFDLFVARTHSRVSAELAAMGSSLPVHDLLIGTTALAIGYTVATRDQRSFPRIPGLTVVQW